MAVGVLFRNIRECFGYFGLFVLPFAGACAGSAAHVDTVGGRCGFDEISRDVITTPSGEPLYVAPQSIQESNGSVLVAGVPTYIWRRDSTGKVSDTEFSADSIIGVIITPEGSLRVVPAPRPGNHITEVRAAALGHSRWSFVFAETVLPRSGAGSPFDSIRGIWHAVFNDAVGGWESLEPIPVESGRALRVTTSSSLLYWQDTLAWAMSSHRGDDAEDIVVFRRSRNEWRMEIVTPKRGLYVDATHSPKEGLLIAAVHADSGERTPGLFLYGGRNAWRGERIVSGAAGQPHHPRLAAHSEGAAIIWSVLINGPEQRREVRGLIRITGSDSTVVTLARNAVTATVAANAPILFFSEQAVLTTGGGIEARLLTGDDLWLGSVPNPFAAAFAATAHTEGTLILSGPVAGFGGIPVVSTNIRLRNNCVATQPSARTGR